jgi:transposase
MVANPRAVASFAKALMGRGKTDESDAVVLVEFAERMPFQPWVPPSKTAMDLRATTRRIVALVKSQTIEKNRLKSAKATQATPAAVVEDMEDEIAQLEERIKKLSRQAIAMVKADPVLARSFELLQTIPGVAEKTAVRILGEIALLAPDMSAKEWVAHAGLDPRPWKSGSSIDLPPRVSKAGDRYIRTALFLPALVAVQHDPHVRAFHKRLLDARKRPLQATVAVMRKLLHAIYGMLKSGQPFDGTRFCPDFIGPEVSSGAAEPHPREQGAAASEARPGSDGPPAQAGAAGAEGVARPGRSGGATARRRTGPRSQGTLAAERGATSSSPPDA